MKRLFCCILCCFSLCMFCSCEKNEADMLVTKENIDAQIVDVYNDCESIITIISDDGYYESGVILNELARKYNIKATVAGVVTIVEPDLEKWKDIEKEGYIEMISHTWSHVKQVENAGLTREDLEVQITNANKYFLDNFTTDNICMIFPENTTYATGYEIAKENNYYAIRQGIRGYNSLSIETGLEPGEWYNLMTMGIGDVQTTEERNEWVDKAIEDRRWLIEMWHYISPNGDLYYQPISTEKADEHIAYMAKKQEEGKIWIASFTEATKYLYEHQYSKLNITLVENNMEVRVTCEDVLPEEIFCFPLTVKITMPKSWQGMDVKSNANEMWIKTDNKGDKYILVNMVPNSKKINIWCE